MLKFIINNREVQTDLPLGSSLVDFIRNEMHLYGTKIGCREGDCGACTILVGELKDDRLQYRTMTSCLAPLGNANGRHIVTIEGINQDELSMIQQEFLEKNGTQCGFCTPGFILSLYGFCLDAKPYTVANAMESIAGNICRCTGYKSIERAMAPVVAKLGTFDMSRPIERLVAEKFLPGYFLGIEARLRALQTEAPKVRDHGYIVAGGTDILLQDPEGAVDSPFVNLVYGVRDLQGIRVEDGRCHIGAATPITDIKDSEIIRAFLPRIDAYLNLMASTPVRNMATAGGNIANGSPIGDLSVILLALDAVLVLSLRGAKREMPLRDFFQGYKKVGKDPEELIESIHFAVPGADTRFSFEKISKREHLDMATVNSALKVVLADGLVTKASFAVGGLGPTLRFLDRTCECLVGRRLDNATFREANRVAQTEVTPRSRADYKRSLVRQQLLIHLMSFAPETVTLEAVQ
jgi:xanthine dehydrogenase small subunit